MEKVCMSVEAEFRAVIPSIYLPTEKMVHDAHVLSLHGGVGLTMTLIRQEYWVPRLRRLTKRVIRACYGCKKLQVSAFANPPRASLPSDRTVGSVPFEVLGVDLRALSHTGFRQGRRVRRISYCLRAV